MSDDQGTAAASAAPTSPGAAPPAADSAASPAPSQEVATRPEHIPEKFWNAETKGIRIKELASSYTALEQAMAGKLDPVKEQWAKDIEQNLRPKLAEELKAQREAELSAKRPESPDKYDLKLSEGVVPKDTTVNFDESDPLLSFWRSHCHALGYGQEEFQAGIDTYVKGLIAKQPDRQAEIAKLGEKGQQRIERVSLWAQATLSDESYNALNKALSSASGIVALEELMAKTGEPVISSGSGSGSAPMKTVSDLKQMQNDPRYWHPVKRDPAFVAEVQKHYKELYPGVTRTSY